MKKLTYLVTTELDPAKRKHPDDHWESEMLVPAEPHPLACVQRLGVLLKASRMIAKVDGVVVSVNATPEP